MYSISKDIIFIGADDDNLDLFEAQYPLVAGISYNSYLIRDDKSAIMDAVDARRIDDWLSNLDSALVGSDNAPAYLVIHHMEPDHSAGIRSIMSRFPEIKLVCTKQAATMLANFFEDIDFSDRIMTVADGDTLSLGRHELKFVTTPMVHWPEVMMTIDLTEQVLFSSDAFGAFAMSHSSDAWPAEARRYYSNIVGRYGTNVQMALKKITSYPIRTIAPLHGPALRDNLEYYLGLYDKWSRYEPETKGVFIPYASIYGGTAEAARRLAYMLGEKGAGEVVVMDLCRHDVSYAIAEAWRLSSMVICSVTYDADVLPVMHDFLHHIEQKKLTGRRVGVIGNGSWAPAATNVMTKHISAMKDMEIVEPLITLKSRLHESDVALLDKLAEELAK